MIGSAKGNLNQKVSVPGMTQTTDTKFDVKLYIINNNLYVEGEVTEGGSKTDVKLKKLNVMDEATLQEIKASLSLQGETQMPSEAMITEDMKFKMYKVKEGHLLELTLTLEDMLNAVEELPTGFEKQV